MADYFGTSINESPTIVMKAGEEIAEARGIALAAGSTGLKKPTAGAMPIGLTLFTGEEDVSTGDDVTVQVKDIGKWVAGAAIAAGDQLMTDASGKAVKVTAGKYIYAIALGPAAAAGQIIKVRIVNAGYAPAGE